MVQLQVLNQATEVLLEQPPQQALINQPQELEDQAQQHLLPQLLELLLHQAPMDHMEQVQALVMD